MNYYREKYLKYKAKYLELKQLGGANYFTNNTKLYITAHITSQQLKKAYEERIGILLGNTKPQFEPHMTLFELDINQEHSAAKLFQEKIFQKVIRIAFDTHLRNLGLVSNFGSYKILGTGAKDFYVREYEPEDKKAITNFRKEIYNYIQNHPGVKNYRLEEIKDTNGKLLYKEFYCDDSNTSMDKPLYRVPIYISGVGVWTPHISIINSDDLLKLKNQDISFYNKNYTDYEKIPEKYNSGQYNIVTNIIQLLFSSPQNPIEKIKEEKKDYLTGMIQSKNVGSMKEIQIGLDLNDIHFSLTNFKEKINMKNIKI
jgi:hypothetical protein